MQPYQERVLQERLDLANKLCDLTQFGTTATFEELPLEDQQLLDNQWDFMHLYLECLDKRIKKFNL
jgi:hypothetical protein